MGTFKSFVVDILRLQRVNAESNILHGETVTVVNFSLKINNNNISSPVKIEPIVAYHDYKI